jgi:superfamily II DNA helicase RecQ
VVFTDKTLRKMAEVRQQNLAELGLIAGVGKVKLERYSKLFLSVIRGEIAA